MSQPSATPPPESASRAGRLDRILRELLLQTPGVEAAAVVSFDGLPMASALPDGMDEDRVAAMSAALLSLAERAAQGLGRGDLSQVYIEGEHGTVFLVSAQDEGVLIAVTSAGAKVGMMLYEVKLAANRVGEVLHGPVPLPPPLPPHVTRGYIEEHRLPAAPTVADVAATYNQPEGYVRADGYAHADGYGHADRYPQQAQPAQPDGYGQPAPQLAPEPAYASNASYEPAASYVETPEPAEEASVPDVAPAVEPSSWSSYTPSGSVLPGERASWS